ncbi:MAG: TonB-dependent receptor [Acidobacteriia bacterium]|nr:TonB-dependent receptor [Terriglobia bacterium]
MKYITTLLSLLVLPIAIRAASVHGNVTDPQGRPVANAAIRLISTAGGSQWTAASGPAGTYTIDNIPPGDYLLRVSSSGFSEFLAEPFHLEAGTARIESVALEIAGLRAEVVVTASSTPQTPVEVSKAITVVDHDEIDNRDTPDLATALLLGPGIRVQQQGGPGALSEIQIRGLRPEDTAVLVDGLRLRDASATQADASALIEDFLLAGDSRIEVLRGSGSSLYGTNAIGGVVNVITSQGGGRTRGSVLVEGGSLGTFRGRAQLEGGWLQDRVQYSFGASQLYVANGVDGDDPYRDTSAQASITFHLSPATRLTARFYGSNSFGKLNSSADVIGTPPGTGVLPAIPFVNFLPAPDNPDYTRAGRFFTGALTLASQPLDGLNYSLSYQSVDSSRRYADGPAGVSYQPSGDTRSLYDGQIQTVNAHADYRLGRHNLLTGGYEFENEKFAYDNVDFTDPAAASATNVTERSHAVFGQDQLRFLGGRLQISAAFRAQFFELQAPAFIPADSAPYQGIPFASPAAAYTGDGSAAYYFKKTGTKLRAHTGRGYRAPSLFERFGAGFDPTFGYTVYGDPRLTPEHSTSLDAGLEQTFWTGRIKASATYFYTWLQNVITFDTSGLIDPAADPFARFIGYRNTRGGISRGVESSFAMSPARGWNISAGYTFVNAVERTPIAGDTLRTFSIPRNQFSFLVTGRLTSRLMMIFDVLVSSNYLTPVYGETVTQVFRFDGMHRINLGGSYRLPLGDRAVRFFARGENLLRQNYFEAGFPTPGRTGRAGMQVEF